MIFNLDEIDDVHKSDKEKALEFYKSIVQNYKGSLFSAEARKRVRLLRGEKLMEDEGNSDK